MKLNSASIFTVFLLMSAILSHHVTNSQDGEEDEIDTSLENENDTGNENEEGGSDYETGSGCEDENGAPYGK